jgi:type IV/VI secretion system ImpK/VasF family protein
VTLFDLTRELFTYLVRFRQMAPTTAAPPLAEVRGDLLKIFARMEAAARREPMLSQPYQQVRYALVALADEILLTSGWEHAPAWREVLLEERFFGTREAADRFFTLAASLDDAPLDVVGIYYLCLGLGFCGRYQPDDPELEAVKKRLLARLPAPPRLEPGRESNRRQGGPSTAWAWVGLGLAVVVAAAFWAWRHWQPAPTPPPSASRPQAPTAPPTPPAAPKVASAKAKQTPRPHASLPPPTSVATTTAATTTTTTTSTTTSTTAPTTQPPVTTGAPPAPRGWRVRVGVYVGPIQSGRLARRLRELGLERAQVRKITLEGGKTLYVVSVTPIPTRAEAEKIKVLIKQRLDIEAVIKRN